MAIEASGPIRQGVLIENAQWSNVASSSSGDVVRVSCHDQLAVLGDDLLTAYDIDLPYQHDDERSVLALARGEDGSIAVITFELDWYGDFDHDSATTISFFDPSRHLVWSRVLERDNDISNAASVAISSEGVFVVWHDNQVLALSRATGSLEWMRGYRVSWKVSIAADPTGGVVTIGTFNGSLVISPDGMTLEAPAGGYDGFIVANRMDGSVRWALTSDALGIPELAKLEPRPVAVAQDGSIAVLGETSFETGRTHWIGLVGADGQPRWSHPLGSSFMTSLATDGVHVVVAGEQNQDGYVASFGETGMEWKTVLGGVGLQRAGVLALPTSDSMIVTVSNAYPDSGPEIVIDDVAVAGNGLAILELARPQ